MVDDQEPALQRTQREAPNGDHDPGKQGTQVDKLEKVPELQLLQSVMEDAPGNADQVPERQLVHTVIEIHPNEEDHVPTPQLVQYPIELAPITDDHVPMPQLLQ